MTELLRYARIFNSNLEGVSLDFRMEDRRLSFEGYGEDIQAYRDDVLIGTVTPDEIGEHFRWLAGLS
jgi:hypothetical protein